MTEQLKDIVESLRKTIDVAAASPSPEDESQARTLRHALALLWSAHDEIEVLQQRTVRHA